MKLKPSHKATKRPAPPSSESEWSDNPDSDSDFGDELVVGKEGLLKAIQKAQEQEEKEKMQVDNDTEGKDEDEEEEEEAEDIEAIKERIALEEIMKERAGKTVEKEVKPKINNLAGLARRTNEFRLQNVYPNKGEIPFLELLAIDTKFDNDFKVNDDLAFEQACYDQALTACKDAMKLHGLSFEKPKDYFTETMKTETHMEKVNSKIAEMKSNIEKAEQRKAQRERKKMSKEVERETLKNRNDKKKKTLDTIESFKKKQKTSNTTLDKDEFDIELDINNPKAEREKQGRKGPHAKKSKDAKDKKYGFGKGGKYSKSNTAASTNDVDGSTFKKMKHGGKGGKFGQGKAKGKTPRLGKTKRAEMKKGRK